MSELTKDSQFWFYLFFLKEVNFFLTLVILGIRVGVKVIKWVDTFQTLDLN